MAGAGSSIILSDGIPGSCVCTSGVVDSQPEVEPKEKL